MTVEQSLSIAPIMDFCDELAEFAQELAGVARLETLARWRGTCAVEDKGSSDYDPVTAADRDAERAMRSLIRKRYPDHGIIGEEWPDEPGTSDYHWSLDPIDGTRSFVCGLPIWTTLIGLLDGRGPVFGLIDAPALDETYVGGPEGGWLTCKGECTQLRTSGRTRLAEASLSTTDPFLFDDPAAFGSIRSAVRITRYGQDGYAYARLAAGSLDLVIESGLKPHDYNALIPVIAAAGGHIGNWHGGEDFSTGHVIAAATRGLYDEVVEVLAAA